jgi:hypothetical protein
MIKDDISFPHNTFDRFLAWLHPDRERAGIEYERARALLIAYFRYNRNENRVEESADFTLIRAERKVGSSLIGRKEINDDQIVNLCNLLQTSIGEPHPLRRIWELLPPAVRDIIDETARQNSFDPLHKYALIKAFNAIVQNPDFYNGQDFVGVSLTGERQILIQRLQSGATDYEVQRLNRLLLESCLPEKILSRNLADRSYEQRYPYIKSVAEYIKDEGRNSKAVLDSIYGRTPEEEENESFEEWVERNRQGERRIQQQAEAEREKLKYFRECRKKCCAPLESWKCRVLLLYYEEELDREMLSDLSDLKGSASPVSSDDTNPYEIAAEGKNEVREALAKALGISRVALRLIVMRTRKEITPCIVRCMKEKGFSETELS